MMRIKYCVVKSIDGCFNKILYTKTIKDADNVYKNFENELKKECGEKHCVGEVYKFQILESKMEVG